MAIKFSELTPLTVVDGTNIVPVVDVAGVLTSKKTTINDLQTYILLGNAATATKLATAIEINGVPFDGSQDITIDTSIPPATTLSLGGVIVGDGFTVDLSGKISVAIPSKLFHGFSTDEDGNLIYTTIDDGAISLQDSGGNEVYATSDMGTNDYEYSIDENGNLIATYV